LATIVTTAIIIIIIIVIIIVIVIIITITITTITIIIIKIKDLIVTISTVILVEAPAIILLTVQIINKLIIIIIIVVIIIIIITVTIIIITIKIGDQIETSRVILVEILVTFLPIVHTPHCQIINNDPTISTTIIIILIINIINQVTLVRLYHPTTIMQIPVEIHLLILAVYSNKYNNCSQLQHLITMWQQIINQIIMCHNNQTSTNQTTTMATV